ncbi:MAG: tandem-95 repeat protein [Candidatus Endonucleobacter sp. (ex Gigantidas childressi)]|nr:tandem-95 repeat protein [Candidatus Endonucleobacter sp. (ex Gigantidas childressi)]
MNPNGNYVVIGHISEDSEPVKVISVDGSIRMVNAGEPVFVGETVLNSNDLPIKIILINNKSILVGLQQELLMEMSDLDDASVIALEESDSSIDELVDGSSNNDSSNKDKVLAEGSRLISQGQIERSDNKVDEYFHEISRIGADERQFTKEHVRDDIPAIPVNNPPIIQSQSFTLNENVPSDGSFSIGAVKVIDLDEAQSHVYAIVGGNSDGRFAINPATGDITVVGEIDYENIDSYDLSIKVTDNGIPPLTTFKTITIDIENANEAPVANPDVATSDENGSLTINVLANDTDVDVNDNPSSSILLSTDIVDTNGDILVGMGEVSISNNQVLFALGSDFDYLGDGEVMDLLIRYQMSDSGGLTSNSFLSITITGTNDQPVIDLINVSGTLEESNSTTGLSTTGTLSFTELDSGDIVTVSKSDTSITWNGGDLTSSLSASLMSGFVISNGGWSYNTSANLDFLGKDQTIVLKYNVIATDNSGSANAVSAAKEVIVTITGTNDQPVIDSITSTGALVEGDGANILSTTGALSFTELDSGDIVTVSKSDTSITWDGGDLTNSLSTSLMSGFVISNSGWSYSTSANLDFLGKDQTIVLKYNVIATDDSGAANAASAAKEVIVTITGTNDQPVIDSITSTGALTEGDSTASLSVDGTLSFTELDSGDVVTVSKSDTSITWSGGDLTSSLSASLMSGFVTSNSGWSYSTSANLDFLGKDQTIVLKYNVIATDDSGAANAVSAAKEVIVTITGTNDQPVIDSITSTGALTEGDSTASLSVDGTLSFTELDSGDIVTVSKSDTSITWNGGDLTSSLSTSLMSGFVISNSGWSYSTSANLDFLGKDQTIVLKYNVIATDDSGAANAASAAKEVIVTITGTNDQPVIDSITSTGALTEGDSTASLSVDGTLSFTELDSGDVVTVSKSDTSITWSGGDLTSSLSASLMSGFVTSNGGWSYSTSANLDFLGKDQTIVLKYNVIATDDSGAANAASAAKEVIVTITGTNDQPVIDSITSTGALTEGDSTASLSVDGTLFFTELDRGDIVTVSKSDTSITWNGGDLTSNLSASLMSGFVTSNSGWSYSTSANLDFLGKDQTIVLKYNVTATDDSGAGNAASAEEEVTVTITGTNDQPVIDSITTTGALVEGDGANILSTTGALSFTELDSGDTVTISKSDTSITWNGGDLTSSISTNLLNGFVVSNEGWSYNTNVNLDFLGKDQTIVLKYNVIATDNSGATNAESADEEVTVIITGTNDAPIISSDVSLSNTAEDTSIIITKAELLANATDAEGANLSVESLTADSGTLVDNGDNTWTLTPSENFNGDVAINYNISDGIDITEATSSIHVDAVADAVNISLASTMGEAGETITSLGDNNITGSGVNAQLSGWLTDNDGGMMEANPDTIYGAGDNRGTVLELERNVGDESNIYQNVDVQAGDTVKLTFDLSARTGTATGQGQAVDVMWEGVVVDTIVPNEVSWKSYTYTFTATTDNPRLELNAPGSDGIGAVLDVITVQEVVSELLEGSVLAVRLSTDLVDTDGSENITSVVMDGVLAGTVVSDGVNSVTVTEDGGEVDILGWDFNNLTITPNEDFFGTFDVNVTATSTDANGTTAISTASTEFVISNINDAPDLIVQSTKTVDEDGNTTITFVASDIDGDIVTTTAVADHGIVTVNNDGTISYSPNANYNGTDTITVTTTDPDGLTAIQTSSITVNDINDAPIINLESTKTVDEDGTVNLTFTAIDVDGTLTTVVSAEHGEVVVNDDGTLTYTPNANYHGIDTITAVSTDDDGAVTTSTSEITVNDINDAPIIETVTSTTVAEGDSVVHGQMASSDVDDASTATYSIASEVAGFTLNDDGSYSFDATNDAYNSLNVNETEVVIIPVTVTDNHGATDTTNVEFIVTGTNDTPVAVDDSLQNGETTTVIIDAIVNDTDVDNSAVLSYNTVESDVMLNGVIVGAAEIVTTSNPYTTYASDMIAEETNIHGGLKTDTNYVGGDISIDGEVVDKGLLMHAGTGGLSTAKYDIPDGATSFNASIAIEDYSAGGSVQYSVLVDGVVAYTSSTKSVNNDAEDISIDVTGASTITLQVDDLGGIGSDHAAWGEARFEGSTVGTGIQFTPNNEMRVLNDGDTESLTINYTIKDEHGAISDATVNIEVLGSNNRPEVNVIQPTVQEDVATTIALTTDIDGTVDSVTGTAANGTVSTNEGGDVIYTPDADYSGTDLVSVTVTDNNGVQFDQIISITIESVNDEPVLTVESTKTVDEDGSVRITYGASDTDGAIASTVGTAEHGTVTVNADSTITYTPTGDYNGTDTITLTTTDNNGATATTTSAITVNAVNDAPIISAPITVRVDEDNSRTLTQADLIANASDIEGDDLTALNIQVNGADATVVDNGDGTFTVTPAENFNGDINLTFDVSDGTSVTSSTINLVVDAVNDAPVIGAATEASFDNGPWVTIGSASIVDGEGQLVDDVSLPDGNGGGMLYDEAFNSDTGIKTSFDFHIDPEGRDSNDVGDGMAVVFMDGAAVNETNFELGELGSGLGATGLSSDFLTIGFDAYQKDVIEILSAEDVHIRDIDVSSFGGLSHETDSRQIQVDITPDGLLNVNVSFDGGATFETIVENLNLANEGITVPDTVKLAYTSATGRAVAEMTISNIVIEPIDSSIEVNVAEDTSYIITEESLLTNASDIDGDTLSVKNLVLLNPENGSIAENVDGTFTFTPAQDFNGKVEFSYDVSDGQIEVEAPNFAIRVTPVNDAAEFSGPATANTDEDTSITLTQADLLANATDEEGDTLTASNVQVNGNDATVVDNGNGTFTVTPDANFNGELYLTFDVSDSGLTAVGTMDLTINAVNDGPVATGDIDSIGTLQLDAGDNLLLTTGLSDDTGLSTVSMWFKADASSGQLFGTDANSGSHDRSITINSSGDLDIYTWSNQTTFETISTSGLNVADGEWHHVVYSLDGTDMHFYFDGNLAATGNIAKSGFDWAETISIGKSFAGEIRDVKVFEDTGSTASEAIILMDGDIPSSMTSNLKFAMNFSGDNPYYANGITVTKSGTPNTEDQFTNQANFDDNAISNFNVLANDSDLDGDTLSISGVSDAVDTNGNVIGTVTVVNIDGVDQVQFIGNAATVGLNDGEQLEASFTYTLSDGNGGADTATVKFLIKGNDNTGAPVVTQNVEANTDEDISITLTQADLLAHATDADGDTLTASNVQINNPDVTIVDNLDGTFTVTTSENFNGDLALSFDVSDGALTTVSTINLTVNPVDDELVISAPIDATVDEDNTLILTQADLIVNSSDVDGDLLVASNIQVNGTDATVVDNGNGTYTVTPNAAFHGKIELTFDVSDGTTTLSSGVDLTVASVNDAPVISSVDNTGTEDVSHVIAVVSDIEGDVSLAGSTAEHGILSLDADGNVTYTPDANYNGAATVNLSVTDLDGVVVTQEINLTIDSVNDIPIFVEDTSIVGNGDEPVRFTTASLLANDIDADGDTLSITEVTATANTHGTVELLDNKSIDLDGTSNYIEVDSIMNDVDPDDSLTFATTFSSTHDLGPIHSNVIFMVTSPDGGGNIFRVSITEDGSVYLQGGNSTNTVNVGSGLNDGEDHTLSVSVQDGGTASVIIDGVSYDTGSTIFDVNFTTSDRAVIGGDWDGTNMTDHFTGSVSDTTITSGSTVVLELKTEGDNVLNDTSGLGNTATVNGDLNTTVTSTDVIFTPDNGYIGDASFEYTISDGNGGTDTGTVDLNVTTTPNSGTLIDGVIEGIFYETSSGLTGMTDENGGFHFNDGDTITFSIGNIELGSITAEEALTGQTFLQDIANVERGNLNDHYLENMATFLQSLDSDEGDNIVITAEMHAKLEESKLDLHTASEEEVKALVESIGKEFVSEEDAMEHVQEMLEKYTDMQSDDFDAHTDDSLTTARLGTLPVVGVNYTTSSGITGITNTDGSFSFNIGDEITFSNANGQEIASIAAEHIGSDKLITMQELLTHAPDMQTQGNEAGTLFIANDDREVIFTDADLFPDNNLVPQTSIDDVDNAGANSLLTDSGTIPDLLSTNYDNISVSGGASIYTFDLNAVVTPENKTSFSVSDFNIDEGDVLLLGDLMVDEDNSLEQLLDFSTSSSETVINIRDFAGGDVTRQVTLDNVDLSVYGNTDAEIINKLLVDGSLQIDS